MLVFILSAVITFFVFKKIIMPIVHGMTENNDKDDNDICTDGSTDFFHPNWWD